jgi:formyl-CoA transferase
LLSSLLGSLANQASAYLATADIPASMGSRHPSIAPYETLAAKDGNLAVCCGNDEQFRKLTVVLGIPATAPPNPPPIRALRLRRH